MKRAFLLVVVVACGGGPSAPADTGVMFTDLGPADTGAGEVWTITRIAGNNVGVHARMQIVNGQPAVAYFASNGVEGAECTEIGMMAPNRRTYRLEYATRSAAGTWATETIADTLIATTTFGIGFGTERSGVPVVTTMSGASLRYPTGGFCGANDVGVYTRGAGGSWALTTAVAGSGEALATGPLAGASNAGQVIGAWPSLAYTASGGAAIVYQDLHFGGIQTDDAARADLEIARRNGSSWQALPVWMADGRGHHNALVFDMMDRPIIVTGRTPEGAANDRGATDGIYAIRGTAAFDAFDERVRLSTTRLSYDPAVTYSAFDRNVRVLFYDGSVRRPRLATLATETMFTDLARGWRLDTLGDPRYEEGQYASMAVDTDGTIAIAYHRCKLGTSSATDCQPDDDALVVIYSRSGGTWSTPELVDLGGDVGNCGLHTSIAFTAAHEIAVAYLCETVVSGGVVSELKFALRQAL